MIIFGLFCLFVVIYIIYTYNRGIALRNYVREAFSTMDVYLKKRWDLIPSLTETVKAYTSHEKDLLEKVTKLRNQNYHNLNSEQKINLNYDLSAGLSKIIATVENYPDLKANEHYIALMKELSSIEEDIANSRKYYNGTVREFNTYIEVFPTNMMAPIFNFKTQKMYEIDDTQRANTKVSF